MTEEYPNHQSKCFASVVIAVHNDWEPLARCLPSLSEQSDAPPFEVIILDDGSTERGPASIKWTSSNPLKILSYPHSGISAARNRGIRNSAGEILVFVDADCIPHVDCLAALASCIAESPRDNYFQLHIAGELSTLAGRAEELRLIAIQDFLLQPDGHIRYLNTSGFAIRRSCIDIEKGLFDERVQRGEDTLLLANLIQRNQLPFFVPSAIVRHAVDLSVLQCLLKTARSAFMQAATYAIIAGKKVNVRVSHRERIQVARSIWCISKSKSIGRRAWLLLVVRQTLRFVILAVCGILRSVTPSPICLERSESRLGADGKLGRWNR
jgi:glycosyltransferase involved in cell wall biosynthesis